MRSMHRIQKVKGLKARKDQSELLLNVRIVSPGATQARPGVHLIMAVSFLEGPATDG